MLDGGVYIDSTCTHMHVHVHVPVKSLSPRGSWAWILGRLADVITWLPSSLTFSILAYIASVALPTSATKYKHCLKIATLPFVLFLFWIFHFFNRSYWLNLNNVHCLYWAVLDEHYFRVTHCDDLYLAKACIGKKKWDFPIWGSN